MIDAGIFLDDILVVGRSLEARHSKIIIAVVDGEVIIGIWLSLESTCKCNTCKDNDSNDHI